MELHNLMEEEVLNVIDNIKKERGLFCNCEKCRLDIAAVALNNLNPKYVVTEKGYLYARVNNMNYQFNTDVVTAVIKAIEVVGKNPKHD